MLHELNAMQGFHESAENKQVGHDSRKIQIVRKGSDHDSEQPPKSKNPTTPEDQLKASRDVRCLHANCVFNPILFLLLHYIMTIYCFWLS